MKIAILSWGSLVETGSARGLAITGHWRHGGPILPIEFSRISQSGDRAGSLTLVLDERNGTNNQTQYVVASHTHLDWAISNLKYVENITLTYSIGYVNLISNTERGWARENHPVSCNTIKEWARRNHFDAVIWTSLLSNFEKITNTPFTTDRAVQYVRGLSPQLRTKALDYISQAPSNLVTPVRTALTHEVITSIMSPPAMTVYPSVTSPPQTECVDEGEETLMRFIDRFRRNGRLPTPTA